MRIALFKTQSLDKSLNTLKNEDDQPKKSNDPYKELEDILPTSIQAPSQLFSRKHLQDDTALSKTYQYFIALAHATEDLDSKIEASKNDKPIFIPTVYSKEDILNKFNALQPIEKRKKVIESMVDIEEGVDGVEKNVSETGFNFENTPNVQENAERIAKEKMRVDEQEEVKAITEPDEQVKAVTESIIEPVLETEQETKNVHT